jgi:insertion element IS1 protein InsB
LGFLSKKKKQFWGFLAVCRETKQIIASEAGSRSKATLKRLWQKIRHIECAAYYTDGWIPYADVLPKSKHIVSKAETYTVESKNSQIRTYVKRFFRKTKGYSKSKEMFCSGLALVVNKINGIAEKKLQKHLLLI